MTNTKQPDLETARNNAEYWRERYGSYVSRLRYSQKHASVLHMQMQSARAYLRALEVGQ